jgi:hypothetical protein
MTFYLRCAVLLSVLSPTCFAQTLMDVEPVKELKPTGSLGTCAYKPTDKESSFYKRLDPSETVTGSFMKSYSIHKKQGKYVSWFGVVRGIVDAKRDGGMTLLVEHKFFDGLTDCHIMMVSQPGGGDFHATLGPIAESIPLLSLVRVYGKVTDEKNGVARLGVEYARVWPWLTFTFTDMGPGNEGNPQWAKYCVLCKTGNVYRPYPDKTYYLQVLGDPRDFGTVPTAN